MCIQLRPTRVLLPLLLVGLLTACSPKEETPPPASSPPEPPTVSRVEPPEPVQEPELPYQNPLTGVLMAEDMTGNRPVAIMLNNLQKALPQLGVSQADLIYEAPAEGGITRMMAVFQSVKGVGELGSVRSARDYYVSLALGHDALYLHAGGSPGAYSAIQNWGVTAFDCVNGPYEGTLYWRDAQRRKSMGMEHSVLTSGDTILEQLSTYSCRLTHKESFSYPVAFLEEGETAQGDPAQGVEVVFSTYKTGVFTYDPDSGLYRVSQYGKPYVDGNNQEQVAVKNVLVLYTDVSNLPGDTAGRLSVRTTGRGSGLFLCDGTVQEITWSKKDHSAPMTYLSQDGTPLELGVGTSYINLVDKNAQVTLK